MAFQRGVREAPEREVVVQERTGVTHSWSPAQIVAVVIGIGYLLLGIAGLARTGLPIDHISSPQHNVLGFLHSPLLGAIEVVFGALLIVAGVVEGGARSLMAFLGVVAAVFGVLLLVNVAPNRLHHALGVGDPYGWLALITGVVLVLAAFFAPEFAGSSRTRTAHREHVID